MNKRSSCDLLSDLPLDIIHAILERIPFRDAARTSILSSQCKFNWETFPHLTFDDTTVSSSRTQLRDVINQLLSHHQGPVLKFELTRKTISQNLDPWLTFLSSNGLNVLILRCSGLYSSADRLIPTSLYSCQNLTHLELISCDVLPPPPTFKGFLFLRRLILDFVCASSYTIQRLLSDSNLLEELKLLNVRKCGTDLDLRIHAPNLKILHLEGAFQYICLYAPLLSHMYVKFTKPLVPRKNSVCTYTELLGSLTALEELRGDPYFFEFLRIGIASCHTPLVFPRLRFIELSPEMFYDYKVESVIAHLCKGAPNLRKIRVSYMYSCRLSSASLHMDSECPFSFTFKQLKVVEFKYPCFAIEAGADKCWMKLIKCFLARSPALETLICVRPFASDEELSEQASTLLTYPRASPNAKIVIRSESVNENTN